MESDNTVTVDTMLYSLPYKRQKTSDSAEELPNGVKERLDNMESHLKLSGMTSKSELLSLSLCLNYVQKIKTFRRFERKVVPCLVIGSQI
jgi:hypothetical protein